MPHQIFDEAFSYKISLSFEALKKYNCAKEKLGFKIKANWLKIGLL